MYINLDEIKSIQLDHTSRCNLLCPQCARTTHTNEVNPRLEMRDLTLSDYETIFTPFIGKNIHIMHCGNYGDVIASPTFDETHDWCVANGFQRITIMTNGSARKPEWWAKLARKDPYIVFSIDGLEDTNHLYRVNSNFSKIIANLKAFTDAGGRARWDFLVFEHNYHQVEEAKTLAKSLGVLEFNVKNTTRFVTESGYKKEFINKKNEAVVDRKDNVIIQDYTSIVRSYGTFEEYIRLTPIKCKYQIEKRYYIDFNMKLWPCCWVGAPYLFHLPNSQTIDIDKVTSKFGSEFNRLDLHGWDNVLNHEFYTSYLEQTWNPGKDRIYTCGRTCGDKYEFSSGFGKNTEIKSLI